MKNAYQFWKRNLLISWDFVIIPALVLLALFWVIKPEVRMWEARNYPVVGNTEILSIDKTFDNRSIVKLKFTRLRDCEIKSVKWLRGSRQHKFEVPVKFSSTKPLVEGETRTVRWIVSVSPRNVREGSLIVTTHRCHFLYDSRTVLYEGWGIK